MRTSARCAARLILSCLALAALSGCYSTRITRAESASPRQPTSWELVQVYRYEGAAPPHETLGEISIKGESGLLTDSFQEAVFRRKAAELGANGIILLYGRQLGGAGLLISKMAPVVRRESRALAIYVKEPYP
jgi:hypothetical protein